jgi:hypothetical protein
MFETVTLTPNLTGLLASPVSRMVMAVSKTPPSEPVGVFNVLAVMMLECASRELLSTGYVYW